MKGFRSKNKPEDVARRIKTPELPILIRRFLYEQLYNRDSEECEDDLLPPLPRKLKVASCAMAMYRSKYDPSTTLRDLIRATSTWRGNSRYDCVFVTTSAGGDPEGAPMHGMHIAQVLLLFSFTYGRGINYPCALVRWFSTIGDAPDNLTGLWKVKRECHELMEEGEDRLDYDPGPPRYRPALAVIHLDCVVRAAHLIGVAGQDYLPSSSKVLKPENSLDYFQQFYVNKYIDLHAHELLSGS